MSANTAHERAAPGGRRAGVPRRLRRRHRTRTAAQATKGRPLLVTVDDLPVAGRAASGDAAARRATTDALLAVLRTHRIPAVAFVIAGNVKTPDDEALLQRWLDAGHELGSHSRTHPSYTALTTEAYLADLAAARSHPHRVPRAARQDAALLPLPVPARRRHAGEGDGGPRRPGRGRRAQRAGHHRQPGLVVRHAVGRRGGERRRRRHRRGAAGLPGRAPPRGEHGGSRRRRAARTPGARRCCCCTPTRWARRTGTRCSPGWRRTAIASPPRTRCSPTPPSAIRPSTRRGPATGTTRASPRCSAPPRHDGRSPRCSRRRRRHGTGAISRRSAACTPNRRRSPRRRG